MPPAAVQRASNSMQILIEVAESIVLDGCGGGAQFLPVCLFGHEACALGLDHVSGVGDILAQLRVAQNRKRCVWETEVRCADRGRPGVMRCSSVRIGFGAGKNLCQMKCAHGREFPMQGAAQMHQATVVERSAILGSRGKHVVQLV